MNICDLLKEKYGYPEKGAEFMAAKLGTLTGAFHDALMEWIETDQPVSPGKYCGYTVEQLMTEFGMNYPAAITTLDWLRREGETALKMLKKGVK